MTLEAVGLYFDYSKNRITDETLKLLVQLASESELRERIDAMFRGDKIQRHGKPSGAARRSAGAQRGQHLGGWQERRARGP
jgi:glucose-6-phosphate isomerase